MGYGSLEGHLLVKDSLMWDVDLHRHKITPPDIFNFRKGRHSSFERGTTSINNPGLFGVCSTGLLLQRFCISYWYPQMATLYLKNKSEASKAYLLHRFTASPMRISKLHPQKQIDINADTNNL